MKHAKPILLLFAAFLLAAVIAVRGAEEEPEPEEQATEAAVDEQLGEGEAALRNLLGSEVQTLDKMLRPMIDEMARTYGVPAGELATVAKEVMMKIAGMDAQTLHTTLGQLAGLGALDINNPDALQELLAKLGTTQQESDGI